MRYPNDFEMWLRRVERRLDRLESTPGPAVGFGRGTVPSTALPLNSFTSLSTTVDTLVGATVVGGLLYVQRTGYWSLTWRLDWDVDKNDSTKRALQYLVPGSSPSLRSHMGPRGRQTHCSGVCYLVAGDQVQPGAVQNYSDPSVNVSGHWWIKYLGGE